MALPSEVTPQLQPAPEPQNPLPEAPTGPSIADLQNIARKAARDLNRAHPPKPDSITWIHPKSQNASIIDYMVWGIFHAFGTRIEVEPTRKSNDRYHFFQPFKKKEPTPKP